MPPDDRLHEVTASIFEKTGAAIQGGPFRGMILVENWSWYGGGILPKLLGTYELELGEEVERIVRERPEHIINIGCAEGYYAVGFALRLPHAIVHAFDIDPTALKVCEQAAKANRAECNLRIERMTGQGALHAILKEGRKSVLFVDCEGCERKIFEDLPDRLLTSSIIIIECHEFLDQGVTEFLQKKIAKTHDAHLIREDARNPNAMELLRGYPDDIKRLALYEGRPTLMHWLCAYPKVQAR